VGGIKYKMNVGWASAVSSGFDGETSAWGSGEVGKLSHHPITPKPYHPIS